MKQIDIIQNNKIKEKIAVHVFDIISKINASHEEGYLVGGAVRDILLDITPKDYDLATSATPEKLKKIFGRQAKIIGRRFRLVHIRYGREIFEVSTFRKKPSTHQRKGRTNDDGVMIWRDNVFGTIKEDAFRRDFTVNALYYTPVANKGLTDFVDGHKDLINKKVRSIGDPETRILEDPVRILRALKLVAQYNFTLEIELEKVIIKHTDKLLLCSKARLSEELLKILKGPYSVDIIAVMKKYDILEHFLPMINRKWNSPHTLDLISLLKIRCDRITKKAYSPSRVLAFGTIIFPFVRNFLQQKSPKPFFWENYIGISDDCRRFIIQFFHPMVLPRFITQRLVQMILALPHFLDGKAKRYILRNSEYMYARELFSILVEFYKWENSLLDEWPEKSDYVTPAYRKKPKKQDRIKHDAHSLHSKKKYINKL